MISLRYSCIPLCIQIWIQLLDFNLKNSLSSSSPVFPLPPLSLSWNSLENPRNSLENPQNSPANPRKAQNTVVLCSDPNSGRFDPILAAPLHHFAPRNPLSPNALRGGVVTRQSIFGRGRYCQNRWCTFYLMFFFSILTSISLSLEWKFIIVFESTEWKKKKLIPRGKFSQDWDSLKAKFMSIWS